MPSCCRPICASCAAWSTARTCRSTSRARCCRTIRRSTQIRKAVTGRVITRAGEPRREGCRDVRQDLGRLRRGAQGRPLRGPRAARASCWRSRASPRPPATAALAQAIRGRPQAQPDRDLLSGRRERRAAEIQSEARGGARARHRGAAADRSGRCVLDHDAAGLRGQAAQVAEPGRRRFRPRAAARRQARTSRRTTTDEDDARDRGGQGRARRARLRRARLAAARPTAPPAWWPSARAATASSSGCWRARTAAAAPSRSSSSTCATRWCKALGAPSSAKRESDVTDLSALLLDQAQILDGEVPDDPAAFAKRLNPFVVRGLRGGA